MAHLELSRPSTNITTGTQERGRGADKDPDSPEDPKQDPTGRHGSPGEGASQVPTTLTGKKARQAVEIALYYKKAVAGSRESHIKRSRTLKSSFS